MRARSLSVTWQMRRSRATRRIIPLPTLSITLGHTCRCSGAYVHIQSIARLFPFLLSQPWANRIAAVGTCATHIAALTREIATNLQTATTLQAICQSHAVAPAVAPRRNCTRSCTQAQLQPMQPRLIQTSHVQMSARHIDRAHKKKNPRCGLKITTAETRVANRNRVLTVASLVAKGHTTCRSTRQGRAFAHRVFTSA